MNTERILLDIETQRDFFSPGGSCHTERSAGVARQIYRLFAWARAYRIPVLSTVLRLRPSRPGPLSEKLYCIDGTEGEEKIPRTTLASRINLGLRNTTDLPDHIFRHYQQVIFEKRHSDIFAHARIERLITELPAVTFVLCGAGVAGGIVEAAVGLRSRGFSVVLAEDAALAVDEDLALMASKRMEAKSVAFAPTAKIVAPPLRPRRWAFRKPEPAERQAF